MADKMDIDKLVLTPEEREAISKVEGMGRDYDNACSLETVKKYHKWENEPCADHWKKIIPRKDCIQCQGELSKLLEEG
ncbi:hypothetical protein LCGC14_2728610 [marine sediment metagenome]|uniref:Uncharacterized protein n=1 Tax=marine sediment metagenome TaxID=412755 RepID=A0A0F8Z811_9ZZZZ